MGLYVKLILKAIIPTLLISTEIILPSINPDVSIKTELAKLNVTNSAIDTATSAQLTEIENLVNAAYEFFSNPSYSDGLALIGDKTNPTIGTLRKKIADRKAILAASTSTGTTTATTGATVTTTVSIDTTITNAIKAAIKQPTFAKGISALSSIIKKYGKNTVKSKTQDYFANAIMLVGGNLYLLYSRKILSNSKKYTITAADKKLAAQWVKSTKTAYPLTQFNALLKISIASKLLKSAQINYVKTALMPAFSTKSKVNTMINTIKTIK